LGDERSEQSGGIVRRDGNVEFIAIDRDGLSKVPVFSQALDNQWLPRELLSKAFAAGAVAEQIERERSRLARAEYIRALINGQQVVVNRAFIYNNEVIYRDYVPTSDERAGDAAESREAFRRLLEDGVLVPNLLYERSPTEPPAFTTLQFDAWSMLSQQVRMKCARLSWDDETNRSLIDQRLYGRFEDFMMTLATDSKDPRTYVRELGLGDADHAELVRWLRAVPRAVLDLKDRGQQVTREKLYQLFVTAEDTRPADRRFDGGKPFGAAVKQLMDLAYAVNLPDALNGYLLTPADSPARAALQEMRRPSDKLVTPDQLKRLLQRGAFDHVMSGAYLDSLDRLTLPDVREIRQSVEWTDYMTSLRTLLGQPESFADGGARAVIYAYANLAGSMTPIVARHHARRGESILARTRFVVELSIAIGAHVAVLMGLPDANPVLHVLGAEAVSLVGAKALPFVVHFGIHDLASRRAGRDLSHRIELMRGAIDDGEAAWRDVVRMAEELSHGTSDPTGQSGVDRSSNLNQGA
jgi:hypothetical protein